MSAQMVLAILDGRKSQTRRTVSGAPDGTVEVVSSLLAHSGDLWDFRPHLDNPKAIRCPFGAPGDRMWVKETIRRVRARGPGCAIYAADGEPSPIDRWVWWRDVLTASHTPRGASRITLEVTDVRVQRLQEISEDDARAEGVEPGGAGDADLGGTARGAFHRLWDSINGERAPWASNPFVWAITFRRIT